MRKIFSRSLLAVAFTLFCSGLVAQSLLWKISGNDLKQPSYLFGTIHMICPEDLVITENVKNAIEKSEQMAFEIDMSDPELMNKMTRLSMNKDMANISNKFSEDDLEAVNKFFQNNYFADMTQLGILKPIALLGMMLPKALSCETVASYEKSFIKLRDNKQVYGLETIEYQMAIFEKIPLEEQLGWLADYSKNPEKMNEEFDEMITVYKTANIARLHELILSSPQFKDYADILLYNRNQQWISKIEEMVTKKATFIAVGAGHLGSEKGLINLLREKGYTVKPIN